MMAEQGGCVPVTVSRVTADPAMSTVLVTLDHIEFITLSVTAFQDLDRVARPAGLDVTVSGVGCVTGLHVTVVISVFPVALIAGQTCSKYTNG